MLSPKVICSNCGETHPPNWPHTCNREAAKDISNGSFTGSISWLEQRKAGLDCSKFLCTHYNDLMEQSCDGVNNGRPAAETCVAYFPAKK